MTTMTHLRRRLTLGIALSTAVVLPSCSQSDGPAVAPAVSSPAGPSPAPSASRRIDITVTGKQVTPTPAVVNISVGESLTIAVTSDHDDELHAHGFEIEKVIKAGQPMVITVKGAQTGVFEVELHHPELRILQVAVR